MDMGRKPLLVIILGLLLLVACSGSAGGPSNKEATAPAATAPAAPAAKGAAPAASGAPVAPGETVQRRRGGKLVHLFSEPPTLDPHLTTDATSAGVIVEVFGGLVTIDPNLKFVPDLAERWDISRDGRVYTFHLRRNAQFHDGKPVTAEDVRWSLERVTNPLTESPVVDQYLSDIVGVKEKLKGAAQTISGLRVIDDHTLELTIDAPKSYFLAKLTYPTGFVLDRKNVEGNPRTWTRQPNGTGPFKLARYEVGKTLRLARNDRYHLGSPYLDEVEMILSGGSPMLMYENDEIHLTGVGLADLDRVRDPANALFAELKKAPPGFSVGYIGLNVTQPPLDDPKVRQALNLAINKQEIASTVQADLVVPAKGIIPPGFPSFNPNLRGYDYNPERAKQLLRESRYGDKLGQLPTITLTIPGSFGASAGLDLDVILQMWQKNLGIRVEVQQTEWATFLQDLNRRRFQMFEIGWIADYPDPENFLDILFHSKSTNNHGSYRNLEVDALLEQARVEPDEATRFRLYNRIEQMIVDDAPWVPLWHSGVGYALVKPKVRDYYLTPLVIPKLRYVYFSD
jgi:ABC-type transport system substrate-binding protein